MHKNTLSISPALLGQISKAYVIERLGLRPEHHRLTAEAAWIRLAQRLMASPARPRQHQTTTKGEKR